MPDYYILVVEDDHELGEIFQELLQYAGYDVVRVTDGSAALAQLAEKLPDAVVLDMHLPEITGEAVLRHIRRESHLAGLKVLVVTADSSMAEKMQPHADKVAIKPIGAAEFLALVESLVTDS